MTTDKAPDDTPKGLRVRATVNLWNLPVGTIVTVDPDRPLMKKWLAGQYLVALPQADQPGASDD